MFRLEAKIKQIKLLVLFFHFFFFYFSLGYLAAPSPQAENIDVCINMAPSIFTT